MDVRAAIEYFHLSFCNRLAAKIDKTHFYLKGGCNLRFYFHSVRYSEDIDFDIHTTAVATLKKQVEKIIADESFKILLRHRDIEIVSWSAPQQTETTQRWKVALKLASQSLNIPTKIEFSRRPASNIEAAKIEFVTSDLIGNYQMQNILLQHYTVEAAIRQKINALIHRNETQARDVVDLNALRTQLVDSSKTFAFSKADKEQALGCLMSVSYEQYKSQVWPYILADFQSQYESREVWDQIQNSVLQFIQNQVDAK